MTELDLSFQRYIKETLNILAQPKKWIEAEKLPFYLRNLYEFFKVSILDTPCLAMAVKDEVEQTPATIQKHILQVQKKWDHRIIYVQSKISAYNRKRLIEHKLPFVVPGNQMFLPFLGIDLREHFKKIRNIDPRCSPSTQTVVLYALLHGTGKSFTPKILAGLLGYTPMTMTRAFDELQTAGLGEIAMEGRERVLRFDRNKKKLWEKARKFLRNPVKKRFWVKNFTDEALGVTAGLTALAHYSALAEPANPVIAIAGKKWKKIKNRNDAMELAIAEPDARELEIWSYTPRLFEKGGVVDRFSLYLSLQANDDERVESALEKMMEQITW
jgi:DNA-binding MarR family transcriptional regulator